MSDFRSSGFLGDVSDWTQGYHRLFSPWLDLYRDFNSLAQDVFFRCGDVQPNDLRRVLAKTLFIRILGNYQAVYLLGERGMEAETQILVRSLCEAAFALIAIEKEPGFAKRYRQHSDAKRLEDLERLEFCNSENFTSEMRGKVTSELATLRAKKAADKGMTILKVWEIAEIAEMTETYRSTYAHFSSSVHAALRSLAAHLVTDSDGNVTHLRFAPAHQDSEFVLRQSMYLLAKCVAAVGDLFQVDITTNLSALLERMNELFEVSKTTNVGRPPATNAPTDETRQLL